MHTKTTLVNHLFYVNGTKCQLSTDGQSIKWQHYKEAAFKEKQVKFSQIIGLKTKLARKIKVYYAKENSNKSTNQLMKLEKVSIVATSNQADHAKGHHHHHHNHNQHRHRHQPKSLIAAEGSTGADGTCEEGPLASPLTTLSQIIESALEIERQKRPNKLLIFVNPFGGKGRASHLYESQVRRLLELANIQTTVVMTKYANHARDTVEDPQFDVEQFDGIVCVGGDGMFAELMNGLLFRYNRDKILKAELQTVNYSDDNPTPPPPPPPPAQSIATSGGDGVAQADSATGTDKDTGITDAAPPANNNNDGDSENPDGKITALRGALGGIGRQFQSPPVPIGVIGAGSTDANSFGLIGTNDVITATLNIILSNQVKIDVCSIHSIQEDRLLRFVSTFVAYGYFGDVIRESEKLRWLGPSRYDVTGLNNLIKNRTYKGSVNLLTSVQDGSPNDPERCHSKCARCQHNRLNIDCQQNLRLVQLRGPFVGVNAAVTACRCPQTKKGFSPNNHLANGCVDLILVRPCSRLQYVQYLLRTGWTKKSAFDLKYVEAYRCRQFEFVAQLDKDKIICPSEPSSAASSASSSASKSNSLDSKQSSNDSKWGTFSSWNVDGEVFEEQSIRVKVNNQLLRVFGTGEPLLTNDRGSLVSKDKLKAHSGNRIRSRFEIAVELS